MGWGSEQHHRTKIEVTSNPSGHNICHIGLTNNCQSSTHMAITSARWLWHLPHITHWQEHQPITPSGNNTYHRKSVVSHLTMYGNNISQKDKAMAITSAILNKIKWHPTVNWHNIGQLEISYKGNNISPSHGINICHYWKSIYRAITSALTWQQHLPLLENKWKIIEIIENYYNKII